MFRDMSRKKQQLPETECIEILKAEPRGVLSVQGDDGYPYGMPMNHWYCEENGRLYFHSGMKGHKVDAIRNDEKVSFCVYDEGYTEPGQWMKRVTSVIVFGRMEIVDDPNEVLRVATALTRKFTPDEAYLQFELAHFAHETRLLKLIPEHMCGKHVTES